MLVQKSLKLIRVKICQNFIARHKRGHVRLSRKLLHLLVRLPIFANVDLLEAIAFLAEIILRINTPGTPLAAVKSLTASAGGNKPVTASPSTRPF